MTDTWFAGHNAERDEYIDKLQARIEELQAYETIVQYVEAENARLRSIAPSLMKNLGDHPDSWDCGWNDALETVIEKMGESK